MAHQLQLINEFLNEATTQRKNISIRSKAKLRHVTEIVEKFHKIRLKFIGEHKKTSCDFNIFRLLSRYVKISETTHTRLIADLLNPRGTHGQGKLFLSSLLREYGISDSGRWEVIPEYGYVDILIKRINPLSIIIIENKSNGAVDQRHQLYRYWHDQIHINQGKYPIQIKEDNFRIIYLTPNKYKEPDQKSLERPENWIPYSKSDNPEKVPIVPVVITLEEFISILDKADYPPENTRIRQHIQQYLDYWKQ